LPDTKNLIIQSKKTNNSNFLDKRKKHYFKQIILNSNQKKLTKMGIHTNYINKKTKLYNNQKPLQNHTKEHNIIIKCVAIHTYDYITKSMNYFKTGTQYLQKKQHLKKQKC
jgi:hypothetical protein